MEETLAEKGVKRNAARFERADTDRVSGRSFPGSVSVCPSDEEGAALCDGAGLFGPAPSHKASLTKYHGKMKYYPFPQGKGKVRPPWPEEARPSAFLPSATLSVFILALLCLALFASGCSLRSTPEAAEHSPKVRGTAISKTALTTVGTPYVYGGSTPAKGFDCSGLVAWAYARHGVKVPRTAKEQSILGSSVSKSALKPGDLVVFRIRSGLHTGIYTGKGRFVHSPSSGKRVRVDDMHSKYWRGKFVAGRRHARVY